jgi:integrase
MGRKSTHRVSRPHPHKRFANLITLLNYRRGPDDDIWGARFLIEGKWTPKDGVSLGTRDFDEAAERARDKYALLANGQPVAKPRATKPRLPEHTFRIYAERAIAKLKAKADEADARVVGKGHSFRSAAKRIENDLLPRWANVGIDGIREHELNEWAREHRVEDRAATIAKHGRQRQSDTRQVIFKVPSISTLGNIDWAFSLVWEEAVIDRVVDRRHRPVIDKSVGANGESRAFIDDSGVRSVMRAMSESWIAAATGHDIEIKRLLRCYIALIAATGIRAGLEAKRIRIGDIRFITQEGRRAIIIRVVKNQGKHPKARSVVVYEGNLALNVRHLLADLIQVRRGQRAQETDYIFARQDGSWPTFRKALDSVLRDANALIDPMSGERRVAYSFRHYFATVQIERGISVAHLAEWMGTSSAVIERHYNRFIVERRAHLVNGAPDEPTDHIDEEGVPWHWEADIGEHGEWVPG